MRFPYYDRGTDVPLRHPSQLYELVLLWCVVAVLLAVDRRFGEERPRGLLAALSIALYFSGRLFLEEWKEYMVFDPSASFTMGQFLSLLPALVGWCGVFWSLRRSRRINT